MQHDHVKSGLVSRECGNMAVLILAWADHLQGRDPMACWMTLCPPTQKA